MNSNELNRKEVEEISDDLTYEESEDKIDPKRYSEIFAAPTDWTVSTLIDQIKLGSLNLDPDYQRKGAWSPKKQSRFIESLMLGIPVPNMLFAEEIGQRGKFNVLNGKQRLISILNFFGLYPKSNKSLKLSGLTILDKMNGKNIEKIKTMFPEYYRALQTYSIRTTILRNIPEVKYLYEIFERINMGSLPLSPQELRQSRYPGPFLLYLHLMAEKDNPFRNLLKINDDDNRMRDIELMLRCHAYKFYMRQWGCNAG